MLRCNKHYVICINDRFFCIQQRFFCIQQFFNQFFYKKKQRKLHFCAFNNIFEWTHTLLSINLNVILHGSYYKILTLTWYLFREAYTTDTEEERLKLQRSTSSRLLWIKNESEVCLLLRTFWDFITKVLWYHAITK